ncbi:MAG: hypothetical protein HY303_16595 [Candidatus Wallbacteria bacterium]|nr:hypothetical protein [Candidatus Wallbacteria bacterium]
MRILTLSLALALVVTAGPGRAGGRHGHCYNQNDYHRGGLYRSGRGFGPIIYASPTLDPSYRDSFWQTTAPPPTAPSVYWTQPRGTPAPEGVSTFWVNLGPQPQPPAYQSPTPAIYNIPAAAPASAPSAPVAGQLPVGGPSGQIPGTWVYEPAYGRVVFVPAATVSGSPAGASGPPDVPIQPAGALLPPHAGAQARPVEFLPPSEATGLPSGGAGR